MPEFYMILARKISNCTRIFIIFFSEKNNKIPEFYIICARKMHEFYIIIARIIFSRILGGLFNLIIRLTQQQQQCVLLSS